MFVPVMSVGALCYSPETARGTGDPRDRTQVLLCPVDHP